MVIIFYNNTTKILLKVAPKFHLKCLIFDKLQQFNNNKYVNKVVRTRNYLKIDVSQKKLKVL